MHFYGFTGLIASLPLFQKTSENEFFDDDPYWNVCCITWLFVAGVKYYM